MFFRGRQGRETPVSEESPVQAGDDADTPVDAPANTGGAAAPHNLGDPTHRLLAALGRFQRQMARARDGLPQEEWSDECMNQLINATEIAVEQGWREVLQILTETARILSSYEAQGRAGECLEFLGDSYEILCNLVGDLITGSLRPTVVQRWNDRHAQALEELRLAGIPLIDGEEAAGPVETEEDATETPTEVSGYDDEDEGIEEDASAAPNESTAGDAEDLPEVDDVPAAHDASQEQYRDDAADELPAGEAPYEGGASDVIELAAPEEEPALEDADAEEASATPDFAWGGEEEESLTPLQETAGTDSDAGEDLQAADIEYEEDLEKEVFDDEVAAAAVLKDWDREDSAEQEEEHEEDSGDLSGTTPGEDTQERLDELNRAVEELIEDLRGDAYPPPDPTATDEEEELAVEGFLEEDQEADAAEELPGSGMDDEVEYEPAEAEDAFEEEASFAAETPNGGAEADPAEAQDQEDDEAAWDGIDEEDAPKPVGAPVDEPEPEPVPEPEPAPETEPEREPQPVAPAAQEPVEGSLTASGNLPGDVAQLLDGFCEEVAGLSTGEGGDIHAVVGRLQGMLEALENRATEMAKDGAVLPCLAMGRLVRLIAGQEAVPDDRFYTLAYDFAGLYKDAGGRSNEPRIQHWLAECDRLLVSWAAAQRGVAMPEGEPASADEALALAQEPLAEEEPPAPPESPPETPAPAAAPPKPSAPAADKLAEMADRSGLDTEALLETARKAMLEGNTANAKLLAMQAAAQIAFQQAREAEQAVQRAEERLKQGIADSDRAARAAKQQEQDVRDAQAAVTMSEGEVVRIAGKTRETANEVEHVEAMIGEIDEQIEDLQRQRAEAASKLKETETRLASAQSEEARAKEELERRKDEEMHARIAQEEAVQEARSMTERRGRLAEAMEEARAYLLSQRDALADIEDTISQVCSAPASKGLPQDELPFQ